MKLDRRQLLRLSSALCVAPVLDGSGNLQGALKVSAEEGGKHRGPCVISSGNGLRATAKAMELIQKGVDPLDAIVAGISIVEADPEDMSVGLGGLPNEEGVVQLDASCMHGPTHRAGAVGALEDTLHAAQVALSVLKRTDHVLLVGEGATRFARALGFPAQDLLTEKARQAWLLWKSSLNRDDDWLDPDQQVKTAGELKVPYTTGTIHCSAVDQDSDLSACTSTSGLSWKLPGRVGDSPIVGAGMYCDNQIGSAGATGRGEAVIQSCGAFAIVQAMERGLDPTAACRYVLERIASRTKRPHLLNEKGEPNFQVVMYALRKDGAYGAACLRGQASFAVHDGKENRLLIAEGLFPA